MKELLSLLPRPSHYIGTEEGSVHKEPASVRLHCALAFPDLYEVGMSYLGHKILYAILNNREDIFAERVYAPCRETGRLFFSLQDRGCTVAAGFRAHAEDSRLPVPPDDLSPAKGV